MKRGICPVCKGPVTLIPLRAKHADGMWVHDHAQMPNGKNIDHDVPNSVEDITTV